MIYVLAPILTKSINILSLGYLLNHCDILYLSYKNADNQLTDKKQLHLSFYFEYTLYTHLIHFLHNLLQIHNQSLLLLQFFIKDYKKTKIAQITSTKHRIYNIKNAKTI